MDHTERFITAFYYAVAGIFLGLGLAIFPPSISVLQ